ncbi:MAG: NnrU family protein [Rhodocyclaceae bacterium]|nr:NnrU family protein [Rhodocyclaceae bacterium]
MGILVLGLVLFLGVHSIRIFAGGWRDVQVARLGEQRWKGAYSIASLAGFALLVWGFGLARTEPVVLYAPPAWARHASALPILPAFVLLAAAYVPGTRIKAAVGHPMVAGTVLWALGHLRANGRLADLLLFGGFGLWAALSFLAARGRDRAAGRAYPPGPASRDAVALAVGVAAWAAFAFVAHGWMFGVRPFG